MNSLDRQKAANKAAGSKYGRLFEVLLARRDPLWRTTFREIEVLLGFSLPLSARCYNAWWANEKPGGRHTHALAWTAAGWKTAKVDMEAETIVFRREYKAPQPTVPRPHFKLDDVWPVFHTELLQKDATFSREEIYEDRI